MECLPTETKIMYFLFQNRAPVKQLQKLLTLLTLSIIHLISNETPNSRFLSSVKLDLSSISASGAVFLCATSPQDFILSLGATIDAEFQEGTVLS